MNITLTPDIEKALVKQALNQETTPQELALMALRERFVPPLPANGSQKQGETLADFLAGYVGVLHSSERVPGGARMSENTGKQFAAGMVRKRQEGKL